MTWGSVRYERAMAISTPDTATSPSKEELGKSGHGGLLCRLS
jgi:hypothetical protein